MSTPPRSLSASARNAAASAAAFSPVRRRAYLSANASISRQSASVPPRASGGSVSAAGRMVHSFICSVRRCVAMSKLPMESISSPQNSMRTGSLSAGEKKSSMPPRRANCPCPST